MQSNINRFLEFRTNIIDLLHKREALESSFLKTFVIPDSVFKFMAWRKAKVMFSDSLKSSFSVSHHNQNTSNMALHTLRHNTWNICRKLFCFFVTVFFFHHSLYHFTNGKFSFWIYSQDWYLWKEFWLSWNAQANI